MKAFQLLIVLVIGWWLLATKYSSYWSGVKIIFYQNPAPNVGYSKFSNRELQNRDPVGNSLFTDSVWDFNPADFQQYNLRISEIIVVRHIGASLFFLRFAYRSLLMDTYYNKYPYHFGVTAFSANTTNLSYSIDDCSIFAIKCI